MCCPVGPMDKAPVYGTGDSGFDSLAGLSFSPCPSFSRPASPSLSLSVPVFGTKDSGFSPWRHFDLALFSSSSSPSPSLALPPSYSTALSLSDFEGKVTWPYLKIGRAEAQGWIPIFAFPVFALSRLLARFLCPLPRLSAANLLLSSLTLRMAAACGGGAACGRLRRRRAGQVSEHRPIIHIRYVSLPVCAVPLAQWIRRRSTEPEIQGSTPWRDFLFLLAPPSLALPLPLSLFRCRSSEPKIQGSPPGGTLTLHSFLLLLLLLPLSPCLLLTPPPSLFRTSKAR